MGSARIGRAWEAGYRAVNARLAGVLAESWHRHPRPLLLHGAELFGCGSILRSMLPHARIGHFCAFAGWEALRALPHVVLNDIMDSLLACDLVGFPCAGDLMAFGGECARLTGSRVHENRVVWRGRSVRLGLFPMPTALNDPTGVPPHPVTDSDGAPGPTDRFAFAAQAGPQAAGSWLAGQVTALTGISPPPVRLVRPAARRSRAGGEDVIDP